MGALLNKLAEQLAQANAGVTDPAQRLELVAARMPRVLIQSWPGTELTNGVSNYFFVLQYADAQDGEVKYAGIARQDLVDRYASTLVGPQAMVTGWEAQHMRQKYGADEAAWLTEGQALAAQSSIEQQRAVLEQAVQAAQEQLEAAKSTALHTTQWTGAGAVTGNVAQTEQTQGQGDAQAAQSTVNSAQAALDAYNARHPQQAQQAALIIDEAQTTQATPQQWAALRAAATRQWLNVIAVDLGGDGVEVIELPGTVGHDLDSLETDGIARFDADNDGFREATEWVGASDALLGLDRNGNGILDDASELFNAIDTPFDQRGLAALRHYDSNGDGRIDEADPVYRMLRLWIDLDGDGSAGALESFDLRMQRAGIDAVALRERLDAAGQAALDAMAGSVVQAIDLDTMTLRFADGGTAQAAQIALQSLTEGEIVTRDAQTGVVGILRENGMQEAYVTMSRDMSVLMELLDSQLAAPRRAELEALALSYGLNPQAQNFFDVVRTLRVGGYNLGGTGMTVYITDEDVWADPALRGKLERMRFSFVSAQEVDGADVFGTARLGDAVWAGPGASGPAFSDGWMASRRVGAQDVVSDAPGAAPAPPPMPEQWVLPTDVFTLDQVFKGAQVGGLVERRAVLVGNAANPAAPAQTVQVYTTATPTLSLAAASLAGFEDQPFGFGFAQLEQEARRLIPGATPATSVRLLGVRAVSHGRVEIDDDSGQLRFVGESNYSGADAGFTYVLRDEQGRVLERRVNLNLAEVNDAPTLLGESVQADEDVPLILEASALLANDTDLEGDSLAIIGIGRIGMGRAELLPGGSIRYTPPADLYGVTDTVEYIVQDARGASAVGVVRITLHAVDDAPTVVSEVIRNAKEDTILRIDPALLLANDFDTDANAAQAAPVLRITAVGEATHGQAFLDANGHVIFTPEAQFNGTATFRYTVTDADGLSTTGEAQVAVDAVNDGPRAFGEQIAAREDEVLVIDADLLLANEDDSDIARGESQHLRVLAVDQAVNGTVTLEDGHVRFTPGENHIGAASFRYTVGDGAGGLAQAVARVELESVNDAPLVFNRAFQGTEDTPLRISSAQLMADVHDVEDGTSLDLSVHDPLNGTLVREGDDFIFTPGANFAGTGGFRYTVCDQDGAESVGQVSISFNGVNDAPVFVAGSQLLKSGEEDQEVRISLAALRQMFVDVDGDAISPDLASLRALQAGDSLVWDALRQELVFRPQANANGLRGIMLAMVDAHGAVGTPQRLDIDIRALNDAPLVSAVGVTLYEDGAPSGSPQRASDRGTMAIRHSALLMHSTDADGDALRVSQVLNARLADGRVLEIVNRPDVGWVEVRPPQNYNGNFSFEFVVSDGQGAEVRQTAWGQILAVNDLPTVSVAHIDFHQYSINRLDGQTWTHGTEYWRLDVSDVEDASGATVQLVQHAQQAAVRQGVVLGPWHTVTETVYLESPMTVSYNIRDEFAAPSNFIATDNFIWRGATQAETAVFRVTDNQGGATDFALGFQAVGVDPVVIDLDGDGLQFIDADRSLVVLDRDGDGQMERQAWVAGSDAILAWDIDGDGAIERVDEYEFWSHVPGSNPTLTDLQALRSREFDTNGDGIFDASDARWAQFVIWQDLNGNGRSEAGELRNLQAAGVQALHLHANVLNHQASADVMVRGYTRVQMEDGRLLQAADVQLGLVAPPATTPAVAQPVEHSMVIDELQLQSLVESQRQEQAAALRMGDGHFKGLPADQKILADREYRYELPVAMRGGVIERVDGGALPAWLHFDTTQGVLSGTPGGGQLGSIGLRVREAGAVHAANGTTFTLTVTEHNQAPLQLGHMPTQFAAEDEDYVLDIAPNFFVDRDAGDRLNLMVTLPNGDPLPAWLRFDPRMLRLQGRPGNDDVGVLDLRLQVADSANAMASTMIRLVVAGINDAPTVNAAPGIVDMRPGQANAWVIPSDVFVDLDAGDVLCLSATQADGAPLPGWLSFDAVSRTLSGVPGPDDLAQPLQLALHATDRGGLGVSTMVTLMAAVWGTGDSDLLVGTSASETLWGLAGADTLRGGAGADRLIGGTGDDTYEADPMDMLEERDGEGMDTVVTDATWHLGDHFENLTLTGAANVNGFGNSANNVLRGNSGVNRLEGATGNDSYYVGAGDVVVERTGEGDDIVYVDSSSAFTLPDHVERLSLLGTSRTGSGNALDNFIVGSSVTNVLFGGDGSDTIDGGAGADSIFGDAGSDWLLGGADGASDTLDGGAGADTMQGGAGGDTYVVDDAGDSVIETLGESAIDQVRSTVDYRLGANVENLMLLGDRARVATGNALNNYIDGNALDNWIQGLDGNDTLSGQAGADTLEGGAGNDTIDGGPGADLIDGGTGNDRMFGGGGDDTFWVDSAPELVIEYYAGGYDTVIYTATAHASVVGRGTPGEYLSGIPMRLGSNVERGILVGKVHAGLNGNELANVLIGNEVDTVLNGMEGDDTLIAVLGNSTLQGGIGDDRYVIGAGTHVISESASNPGRETIFLPVGVTPTLFRTVLANGLTGRDWVSSDGRLRLQINGLSSSSRFVFADGSAWTTAQAVSQVPDLSVPGMELTGGSDAWAAATGTRGNLVFAGDGNDTLQGGVQMDLLYGGAGHDLLKGDGFNDMLSGGAGNDTLIGGAGDDGYALQRGDGADLIDETGGGTRDALRFGRDITPENLWFRYVGNSLEVSIVGTTDQVTIKDWKTSANNQIELFQSGNAMELMNARVNALVQAMAVFSPPPVGQTMLSPDVRSTLSVALATAWQ